MTSSTAAFKPLVNLALKTPISTVHRLIPGAMTRAVVAAQHISHEMAMTLVDEMSSFSREDLTGTVQVYLGTHPKLGHCTVVIAEGRGLILSRHRSIGSL